MRRYDHSARTSRASCAPLNFEMWKQVSPVSLDSAPMPGTNSLDRLAPPNSIRFERFAQVAVMPYPLLVTSSFTFEPNAPTFVLNWPRRSWTTSAM